MDVELHLQASQWVLDETKKLLEEYEACKSEHARKKLLIKMERMMGRLQFELRELKKLL